MWLPKDERRTLQKYHYYLNNINETAHFINLSQRAYNANTNLIERGLVHEIEEGGKEHSKYMGTWLAGEGINLKDFLSSSEEDVGKEIVLKFNLKGLDLAKKYDNWFIRTGL